MFIVIGWISSQSLSSDLMAFASQRKLILARDSTEFTDFVSFDCVIVTLTPAVLKLLSRLCTKDNMILVYSFHKHKTLSSFVKDSVGCYVISDFVRLIL
ncbi:hypothetical protein AALP_AA6G194400 [Arabis alpina]|uniref:Uncharacterized protein n=1 Tax=Arabis alpina TaxID=50452 RepID=A0A087GQA7_ARAAL|nr:hypothetical protein AALP_AA6G194400 [Arabis alpina]